jgi:hypothetical protein
MFGKDSSNYEGIKKMLENPVYAGKLVMKDMLPVKQSTVILDFAKPLLDKIDMSNKKVLERTIGIAIDVWNYCIVINKACDDSQADNKRMYKLALTGTIKQKHSIRISDYYMMIERKEELYPDNQYFIMEHNVRWNADGSEFSLSVITNDASKV